MTPTVFLFDVDGTLITTGGAGRRAIERAIASALGLGDHRTGFSFAGMTDRAIIRAGLRELERASDDHAIDSVIEHYLPILAEEVETASPYRVHDGMIETLERLAMLEEIAVGLGTGNIEEGARIKLERVGLNGYFSFGGFGCDHELRPRLIRAGAQRGAEALGQLLDACRVVVIGDTPKDVDAAHRNGFVAMAVATGGASREELESVEPEWLFDDLTDPAVWGALTG